jgi:2-keto-4-pentenoate hydratase/2-oxohepta-3-ene-1,7-dioic acid hydratase in catechol pathway
MVCLKIARLGNPGAEKPALIINDLEAVFVDDVVSDFNRETLSSGAIEKLAKLDLTNRPRIKISEYRLGSPVARPTKAICVGLNYLTHAHEMGVEPPKEPLIFMKAPDSVVGGFDDIVIPPHSTKTDYEAELCVVIGQDALYLESPAKAHDHILGYAVSQDVSEREWQIERSGQWMKGKSFPTFNPIGPWVTTRDEFDPSDVRIWAKVDGQIRQDSKTSDMIFKIDHCVWYMSQFMELKAGDIINTGTPEGVGMGHKPEKFLKPGQVVETGIDGLGVIKSQVVNYK